MWCTELGASMTWALSNLCRGEPAPSMEMVDPILRHLRKLLSIERCEPLASICWACVYLVRDGDSELRSVVAAIAVERLIEIPSQSEHANLIGSCLKALATLLERNSEASESDASKTAFRQMLVSRGLLRVLSKRLRFPKAGVRNLVCNIVERLLAGSGSPVESVLADKDLCQELHTLSTREDVHEAVQAAYQALLRHGWKPPDEQAPRAADLGTLPS
mmetsp:Transcript_23121/g.42570  ORF Transcript_23121/g.42570 Transcript_23121/m.42570 type:complete len:218 (+) Transcript_23121:2-655(+)